MVKKKKTSCQADNSDSQRQAEKSRPTDGDSPTAVDNDARRSPDNDARAESDTDRRNNDVSTKSANGGRNSEQESSDGNRRDGDATRNDAEPSDVGERPSETQITGPNVIKLFVP